MVQHIQQIVVVLNIVARDFHNGRVNQINQIIVAVNILKGADTQVDDAVYGVILVEENSLFRVGAQHLGQPDGIPALEVEGTQHSPVAGGVADSEIGAVLLQ